MSSAASKRLASQEAGPRRLGPHHFAHLRAVAEGVAVVDAARRYLGIDHAAAARGAHRTVVDLLRAAARRAGDHRWRLVGLAVREPEGDGRPDLHAWAAAQGLEGWSEAELAELYREAFPSERRAVRNARLRARQLEALRDLERIAAERPQPHDPIDAWFEPQLAARLQRSGLLLLQDLQALVRRGGRWWRSMPAIGQVKAARIRAHLEQLLPPLPRPPLAVAADAHSALPALPAHLPPGANRAPPSAAGLEADTDAQAVQAWIRAKAGSEATRRAYEKEARRLLLWAAVERGKALSGLVAEDCLAYLAFLEHVPERWISRARAKPLAPGWAPFSGQLSHASRRHAVAIVASLFAWLVDAGYLLRNPWTLVNRRTGDDRHQDLLDSRAFEPQAWGAILDWLVVQPASPSRERILFILRFTEATGLRAAELIAARLGHLRRVGTHLALQVHGKGARNRLVAVPGQARQALADYLASRGLPPAERADPELPLLASTTDPTAPLSYHSLYATMRSWVRRALRHADLPEDARRTAARASVHWLRHTFGTRAIERGLPQDVVQRQLGHADPRTTSRYVRTQTERLLDEVDKAFG